jgi:hypothetical protein
MSFNPFEEPAMRHDGARHCAVRSFSSVLLLLALALWPIGAAAQTNKSQGGAEITSVGPINTKPSQTIVISGKNFGTDKPYNGCGSFLRITDVTSNQVFGAGAVGPFGGCLGPLLVTFWTDTEIDVEGFPSVRPGQEVFKVRDMIKIEVANPQQQGWVSSGDNFNGSPLAWFSVRVTEGGADVTLPPADKVEGGPEITTVGPVSPRPTQTIVIRGKNFGDNKPYNGCGESFLHLTNLMNNQVFGQWGQGGSCMPLLVTSWTDSEIDIGGFPTVKPGDEAFKVGDMLKIEVANPKRQNTVSSGDNFNGAPVAWFSVRVTPGGGESQEYRPQPLAQDGVHNSPSPEPITIVTCHSHPLLAIPGIRLPDDVITLLSGCKLPPDQQQQVAKGQASMCVVITHPSGAEIDVDGNRVGASPLVFVLPRQGDEARTIQIKLNGYRTMARTVVPDGKTVPIGLTLEKGSN